MSLRSVMSEQVPTIRTPFPRPSRASGDGRSLAPSLRGEPHGLVPDRQVLGVDVSGELPAGSRRDLARIPVRFGPPGLEDGVELQVPVPHHVGRRTHRELEPLLGEGLPAPGTQGEQRTPDREREEAHEQGDREPRLASPALQLVLMSDAGEDVEGVVGESPEGQGPQRPVRRGERFVGARGPPGGDERLELVGDRQSIEDPRRSPGIGPGEQLEVVGAEHDHAAGAEVGPREHLRDVVQIQRAEHHAGEGAVAVLEPPGDDRHRPGDDAAGERLRHEVRGPIAQRPEVLPVREVVRLRGLRRRE